MCACALQLETEKNRLEHFLNSNLVRRRDRLNTELTQVDQEDCRQKLTISRAELDTVNQRISENDSRFSGGWVGVTSHAPRNHFTLQ